VGATDRLTVWNSAGSGTYYAYIDGVQYEGQSGYSNLVDIFEQAEEGTSGSCAGWSGAATFQTWQRYYLTAGAWTTVQSSNITQQCWSVGSISGGTFSVSH
jgi:hypothetical protein